MKQAYNPYLPEYEYVPDGNGHYIVRPSFQKTKQHFTGTVNYEKSSWMTNLKNIIVKKSLGLTVASIFTVNNLDLIWFDACIF